MRTFGTLLKWAILLPILIAILLLAVANGQVVTVHLNPFNADDPVLKLDLPLYQVGFLLFFIGAIAGGVVAWASGLRHRRRARARFETPTRGNSGYGEARPPAAANPASGFLPRPERG